MRKLALLASSFLFATAACTSLLGDFGTSESGRDAGRPMDASLGAGEDGSVAAMPSIDLAVPAASSIYLGQTATLDASKTTATGGQLALVWSLSSVPPGSRLTSENLMGATTAKPSFVPDVAGRYLLHLEASATGVHTNADTSVTATLPQIFFARGTLSDAANGASASAVYMVADSLGGNAHAILCPDRAIGNITSKIAPDALLAGRLVDFWEGPAGTAYQFAAFTLDYTPSLGYATHLWVGTGASTCSSAPVDLGSAAFAPAPYGTEPHFSPDGSRFVVYDSEWNVVTYASDGTDKHVVSPYMRGLPGIAPTYDDGPSYIPEPPRVEWTATGLAWARSMPGGWQIVTAPDANNVPPTVYPSVYMNCAGVAPREIAMLAGGAVVAGYRQAPQSAENIYLLKPDATQTCQIDKNYTQNLSDAGASLATDFAVSPDGKRIAFLWRDQSTTSSSLWLQGPTGQLPGGRLYVVPVDHSVPPQPVSTEPAYYGPRWIGGGTALVFTRLDGVTQNGAGYPATSVIVIRPDGSGEQVIATGDGVTTFVSTSGNAACNLGSASVPGSIAALFCAALVALRMRRARWKRGSPRRQDAS
jgi:hypothetical protein